MVLEFLVALLLGVLFGVLTGLVPGVHINLVAVLVLSLSLSSSVGVIPLLVFLSVLALTHTFVDVLPSVFLGAPGEEMSLSVLPGHKFLLSGMGHFAVHLTLFGSLLGVLSLFLVVPLFVFVLLPLIPFLSQMMAFFLVWVVILMLFGERKFWFVSLLVFVLSGLLGLVTLSSPIREPLLPLFAGLFGVSTLVHSLSQGTVLPFQDTSAFPLLRRDLVKPFVVTVFVSPIASLFPGLGSSQAAVIGSKLARRVNRDEFLVLLGSINTLVMLVSFLTLFFIGRTRTGIAAVMKELVSTLTINHLFIMGLAIIIATPIAFFITSKLSKIIAKNLVRIPYKKVSLATIMFITIITTIISGPLGVLVLVVSTLTGLTCIHYHTKKTFLMGSLLLPTIIHYLPI
jgi:putative membrane protein